MIVDISDPTDPHVVNAMGPPDPKFPRRLPGLAVSVMISQADGSTLKAGLPATATVARRPGSSVPTGGLHSLSMTNDGRYAFYALLTGSFAMVDVSDFTWASTTRSCAS